MGGILKEVITLEGKLINVGPWDECVVIEREVLNPWVGDGDAPEDWDFQERRTEVVTNPMPEGALIELREVIESAKGRILLSDDWHALREDAYPSIKDQLDAFWKGGEDAERMGLIIREVKERYPKM